MNIKRALRIGSRLNQATSGYILFSDGSKLAEDSGLFWDNVNKRLGIGTTPAQKLDVAGKIALNGIQVAYMPTAYTGTLIIGDGGGSLDTGADYNTFVGIGAGFSNTTGYRNTANGFYSLFSNTTGCYNTANGMYSLRSNTTGSQNTANGMYSLFSNTTGNYNTANGYASLYYNTTGSYNFGLGYQAGLCIADGSTPNETGSNNTFIGSYTKALADGDTNEIVIGYDATGFGDNSVVLGNDDVLKTVLRGEIITNELSSDPADPAEGQQTQWTSDGTGSGDDGDVMMKITAGGVTKTVTIVDFSAL